MTFDVVAPKLEKVLVLATFVATLIVVLLGFQRASTALLLFWLESAILLGVTAAHGIRRGNLLPLLRAVFFGFFLFVHLQFLIAIAAEERGDVFAIFDPTFAPSLFVPILLPGLALLAAHLFGVFGPAPHPDNARLTPVGRVLVLHVALVLGSFFTFVLGTALPVFLLLSVLRLAVELAPPPNPTRRRSADQAQTTTPDKPARRLSPRSDGLSNSTLLRRRPSHHESIMLRRRRGF